MKLHRNPLFTATSLALSAGVVAGLAMTAAPAHAQDDEGAAADRIQVTGSRIIREDIEGALPVAVIEREDIDLSGKTSLADLLRNTPSNIGGSFRPQSGNSAQSVSTMNLRNLGSARTLVLVDGRRLPIAPTHGTAQDLSSIPLAAVERIEILGDGASAIYGSDAVAGVVNIITRKDYEGAEVMYGLSDPKRKGGDTEEGHVLFGINGDRGNIMVGASFNQRDIVWGRDREWSTGGTSTYSNNFTRGGFNQWIDHPDGPRVPGDGCTGPAFRLFPGGICDYEHSLVSADEAEMRNESLFTRTRYDINQDWMAYMNASVSRVKSFGRYAPVPSSPWPGGQIRISPDSPNHPGNPDGYNAGNTDGYNADEDIFLQHRFAALGARDTHIESNLYDIDVGLDGRIGNWYLNAGARNSEFKTDDTGYNYVVAAIAQELIESGAYNIYDPFSVDAATANSMIATISRKAESRLREFYVSASTSLFDLPAGAVGFAAGIEYREETFRDQYDSLSEAGQIVGSSGGSSAGDRDVKAVFAEFLVPIIDNLELSLAARYDDYSDYGDDFAPKASLRWQPISGLTLRTSYGEGFRAPSLSILHQAPSFGAASVVHAPTAEGAGLPPTQSIQVNTYSLANPDLESETSKQWSLGVGFQPTGFFSGSLDYWHIKIDDAISSITAQGIIDCVEGRTQNCPDGLSVWDPSIVGQIPDSSLGLGVAINPDTGGIVVMQTGFANFGTIETRGVDLGLDTNVDFGAAGRLRNNLVLSYMDMYKVNGNDIAGERDYPHVRGRFSTYYDIHDFNFTWNVNYIGKQSTNWADGPDGRVHSWVTHDVQGSYNTPWNGTLALGVDNLGDKDPPLDAWGTRGFNWNLYNGHGRVPYVRYVQRF